MWYVLTAKIGPADWIQIALAIITIVGIFIAFKTSNQQIKSANKQSLFNRRLDLFMIAEEFKSLLASRSTILKIPEKYDSTNSLKFMMMTNNSRLNKMGLVIPNPFDARGESSIDNPELQRHFLAQRESLLQDSVTAELVFSSRNDDNKAISDFIHDYIILLDGRRMYDVAVKSYRKFEEEYNERHDDNLTTEEYFAKETNEANDRKEMLIDPIEKLNSSFENYLAHRDSIKEQITL